MLSIISRSDKQLVHRVLSGKHEEFNILINRYLSSVYAVAYSRCSHHMDAEDITQDAFINAYQSLDQLREPKKFSSWVISIARNLSNQQYRKKKRENDVLKANPTPSTTEPSPIENSELKAQIQATLDSLDHGPKEVLSLHYFAGHSTKEIARMLDINDTAVRKRLQRAREELGQKLIDEIDVDDIKRTSFTSLSLAIIAAIKITTVPWSSTNTALAASGIFYTLGKSIVFIKVF